MDSPEKEIAKHVRLVHFLLLTVSFGLMASTRLDTTDYLSRVEDQLRKLVSAGTALDDLYYPGIEEAAKDALDEAPFIRGEHYLLVEMDGVDSFAIVVNGEYVGVHAGAEFGQVERYDDPDPFVDANLTLKESLRTVPMERMIKRWNLLGSDLFVGRVYLPISPSSDIVVPGGVGKPVRFAFVNEYGHTVNTSPGFRVTVSTIAPPSVARVKVAESWRDAATALHMVVPQWTDQDDCRLVVESLGGQDIHLEIHYSAASTLVPSMIDDLASELQVPPGEFSESFPDLTEYVRKIETIEVTALREVLSRERGRAGTSFEFLGAKVPVRLISAWGVVILIGTQLYLLLHLQALSSRKGWVDQIPWIGAYSSFWSRCTTALSVVVIPIAAALVLQAQHLGLEPVFGEFRPVSWIPLRILAIFGSVVMAVGSSLVLRTLWSQTR